MHERHLLLATGDGLSAMAAVPIAGFVWHALVHQAKYEWFALEFYAVAWVIALLLVDGYSVQIPLSRGRSAAAVAKAIPVVIAFTSQLFFAWPYHINRPVALLAVGFGAVLVLAYRLTVARLLLLSTLAIRAVVVGYDQTSADLQDALSEAEHEFRIVGSFDTSGLNDGFDAVQLNELQSLMEQTGATAVVVSDEANHISNLVEACVESGIRLAPVASLVEQYERRVRINDIDNEWFLRVASTATRRPYLLARRILDVIFCAVLGIPYLVLLPLLAAAVKIESRGPIFLRQLRLGQFGRPIWIVKLRTMQRDAETGGPQWAAKSDARITRVGALLRRTRLDEFCQLWNVLLGEMTLIGPRPERPEFVSTLASSLPHYRARMMVKPGITGWAQVRQGYAANVGEAMKKLEYDLYYVKNRSFGLDFQILVLTSFTVMGLRGR